MIFIPYPEMTLKLAIYSTRESSSYMLYISFHISLVAFYGSFLNSWCLPTVYRFHGLKFLSIIDFSDRPYNLQRKGDMDRGVSSGGGQSSLGYLFGSGEVLKQVLDNAKDVATESRASHKEPAPKPNAAA